MAQKTKKMVWATDTIDRETGEVLASTTTSRVPAEPEYVKVYLDAVAGIANYSEAWNPVVLELLKSMSYADSSSGGQYIPLTKFRKEQIAASQGLSLARVNHIITECVKKGVLIRVARSVYQANPYLFGKGSWQDVSKLRRLTVALTCSPEGCFVKSAVEVDEEAEG